MPAILTARDRLAVGVAGDGYRIFDTATGRSSAVPGVVEVGHESWYSWSPDGSEIWFTADPEKERPLEALTLSGRRRTLLRIAGTMSLYDVSREGAVLFEHAFARGRVFVRAPGEATERDLSVFDSSWLSDLSADGRFALVTERGAALAGKSVVYLRRTDGSPPMRLAEDGMGVALSPDARWALVRPARIPVVSKWSGLRVVPVGPGNERTIPTPAGLVFGVGTWVSEDLVLIAGHEADWKWHEYLLDVKSGALRLFIAGETGACAPGPRSVACVVVDPPIRVELFPYAGGASRVLRGFDATMVPRRLSDDERSALVLRVPPKGRARPRGGSSGSSWPRSGGSGSRTFGRPTPPAWKCGTRRSPPTAAATDTTTCRRCTLSTSPKASAEAAPPARGAAPAPTRSAVDRVSRTIEAGRRH